MNSEHHNPLDEQAETQDTWRYVVGLVASLVLTGAAFGSIVLSDVSSGDRFWMVCGLAIVQLIVQLHSFLHVDLQKSHRDDLQLILFTAILAAIMIGGTIWITADQMALMG